MGITAEVYKDAALEHITVAQELYSAQRYVLAHYISGLAVECIFRAYKARRGDPFDERHGLHELAKGARFYDLVPDRSQEILTALGLVVKRWLNNHRYRSAKNLDAFLKEKKLNRGIKGDYVKENSRIIVAAANRLVKLGVEQWEKNKSIA